MMFTLIELPLWLVVVTALAGVVVGMFLLMAAIMLLGRSPGKRVVKAEEPHVAIAVTEESKPAKVEVEPVAESEAMVAPLERYKPIPPVRQHYWYYVSGVDGRFATLRDALTASGVVVPADKMLDWKKLTADTRARIKRVKVGDEQSALERVAIPEKTVQATTREVTTAEKEPEQLIRKSIGGGAFVTYKKKTR